MNYYKIRILFAIIIGISTEITFAQLKKDSLLYKYKGLTIFNTKAEFNNKEIYNAEKDLIELKKKEGHTDGCPVSYNYYYNPLSLIGKYYSYESGENGEYACGPPSSYLSVQTIDLTNSKPVLLTDFFTRESIIDAFKKDQWIVKLAKESTVNLDSIYSINDFIKTLNSVSYAKFKSNGFAILGFDKKTGLVAIRFVGTAYMGYNHNKHLQLGLWLKPKKDIAKLFRKTNRFYIGEFKNGLYN